MSVIQATAPKCMYPCVKDFELVCLALFIPSIHAFALSGSGINLAHLPDLMVSTIVVQRESNPR